MTLYLHAKNKENIMNSFREKYEEVNFGPKNAPLWGIWGKIDFFRKFCGVVFLAL